LTSIIQLAKKSFMFKKNYYQAAIFSLVVFLPRLSASAQITQQTMSEKQGADSAITIHQETDLKASPTQLYGALISSKEFSDCTKKSFPSFSAASARIDPVAGGSFSLFDGHIVGRILELVPNERIVEAWRVVDWPAGIYSIARFEFRANTTGTTIVFDHTGFPEGLKEHLSSGWKEHYWIALANYFQ
jgi:activator of HSP90 ATPase